MKALVFHGPGDVRCDGVAEPTIQAPDAAILRVTAASICGSDLHLYHGRLPVAPASSSATSSSASSKPWGRRCARCDPATA